MKFDTVANKLKQQQQQQKLPKTETTQNKPKRDANLEK